MSEGFCPTCGKPRTGERFCASCGNDFWKTAGDASESETQPIATSAAPAATSAGSPGGIPRSIWLGIIVVSLLVIGGYVVFANNGSQPVAGATASPTASASPTTVSTPTPTPNLGTGIITFGTAFDPNTLLITKQATTFKQNAEIAWSASFSEPAGATSIEWVISKISGSSGVETVVYHDDVTISDPKFDIVANKVALGTLLTGPGKYTMRYFRAAVKLAEGSFTLTK